MIILKTHTLPYHSIFTVVMFIALSGVFVTPLAVSDGLHDPTRLGKIFFFAWWMLFVIPAGIIAFISNRKQPLGKLSLFVLACLIWIIFRGKVGGIWHDEKFFWFSGCFAFFLITEAILANALKSGRQVLSYLPAMIIVLVTIAEAVMGLLQLYGGYPVYHSQFKVTDTFFNPAPYAGFLVASLPWALLLWLLLNEPVVGTNDRYVKGRYEYIHILDDSIAFSRTEKYGCKELMDCYSWTMNNLFKSITVFLVFLPLFAVFSTMMFYEKDIYHAIYGVLFLLAFLFIVTKMMFFASGKTLIPKNDIINIHVKYTVFGTALLIKHKEFRRAKKRGFILPKETGQTARIIRLLENDCLILLY